MGRITARSGYRIHPTLGRPRVLGDGATVRTMREQRGWTQTGLAEAAGMTQSALARFEAGGTVPTLALLERIAHAFHAELVVRFDESSPAA